MDIDVLEALGSCLHDLQAAALQMDPDSFRGFSMKCLGELLPDCTVDWQEDSEPHFSRPSGVRFNTEECGLLRLAALQALGAWQASKQLSLSRALGRGRRCAALVDLGGSVHATQGAFFESVRASWPTWKEKLLPAVLRTPTLPGVNLQVRTCCWTVELLGRYLVVMARPAGAAAALTAREQAIAAAVLNSPSQMEAARQLRVSSHTVRNTLVRVYSKLGVRNRLELALRFRPELISLSTDHRSRSERLE